MIIPVDENWRIKSDEHCWAIQRCEGFSAKKQKTIWRSEKFFSSLGGALRGLAGLQVRLLDTESLEDAIKGIDQIQKKFDDLEIDIKEIRRAA